MQQKNLFVVLSTLVIFVLTNCYIAERSNGIEIVEQSVVVIPLDGPITSKKAELSGLAWVDNTLVLLPQYPEKFGPADGVLFSLPKSEIIDYLDRNSDKPLTPDLIEFIAPGLKDNIKKYEGYEAIEFLDQTVYMTIESGKDKEMMGYLISGIISPDLSEIQIDTSHIVEIQPAVQMDNRTDEALFVMHDKLLTLFEINGADLNPQPVAHIFGLDLSPMGTIPFPQLEYRVTDATLAPDGRIWVINYLSPNDSEIYPSSDPLAAQYGLGKAPDKDRQVERLVALNYTEAGITLADQPPLQIHLIDDPRNWEGIVLLDDRGFLLVTDTSPDTMLGFLPFP